MVAEEGEQEEEEEEEMEVVGRERESSKETFSDIKSIIESFSCVRNKQEGARGQSEHSLAKQSLFIKRAHHHPKRVGKHTGLGWGGGTFP